MSEKYAELEQVLREIEAEMQVWSLWSANKPSLTALQSVQPFCIDTLSFWQWVQWIMLPKFQQIIEQQLPLPKSSNMAPMIKEALQNNAVKSSKLIEFFDQLDQLLTIKH